MGTQWLDPGLEIPNEFVLKKKKKKSFSTLRAGKFKLLRFLIFHLFVFKKQERYGQLSSILLLNLIAQCCFFGWKKWLNLLSRKTYLYIQLNAVSNRTEH